MWLCAVWTLNRATISTCAAEMYTGASIHGWMKRSRWARKTGKPMIEDTFAFIIHPIQIKKDAARKVPIAKFLTEGQINFLSRFFPPLYISEVTGIQSQFNGRELRGWLLACPFTPPTMLSLPVETVYRKIVACGHMAEE